MSLRLRTTAFGIPRTSPAAAGAARAVACNATASVPFRTPSLHRGVDSAASSRPSRNDDGAKVFPRVFFQRRRPVLQHVNHPGARHRVRILDKCWGGENLQRGRCGRTNAARESGDGLQESANDDGFNSFVRDESECAARAFGDGRELGRSCEQSVQRSESFRERSGRDFCVEGEADSGSGNFSECFHTASRDVRELGCLTRVVESPGQDLLAVLHQQEKQSRQRDGSNGSVRLVDPSRRGGNGNREGGWVGPRARGVERDGGGSSVGGEAEVWGVTQGREASRGAGGGFLGEMKVRADSNAESAFEDEDEIFMGEALFEARKAAMAGEVPVGCVIVQNRKILARAFNSVESKGDPTAHAEMLCIQRACKNRRNWRLTDATMYVTLEPCPMCAGAILQARVGKLVWGSRNTLLGADGSWVSLFPDKEDNEIRRGEGGEISPSKPHPFHRTLRIRRGVLAKECAAIMKSFFQARRINSSMKTKPQWPPTAVWALFKRIFRRWLKFHDS